MTAATVLAALAGACAAGALVELDGARPARRVGRGAPGGRLGRAAAAVAALGRVARAGAGGGASRDLDARIAAAGAPLGLGAADVVALKAGAALVGLLVALPLAAGLPPRLAVVALLCAPAGGFLAPDVLLARRARMRAERMAAELGDALDLLRVAVQAGLPVGRALAEVGRRRPGPLAAELRAAAARMELGVPRAEALDALAARCPVDGVAALASAIGRAERHGAPLAPALEALAAEARAEQARRLRDAAARAAPKIQLVVALVLVPAVMALVAAVLALALAPG